MFEHAKTVVDGVYKWTAKDGKVTGKAIVDGKHTLDCGVYGKFLVTKELYESVQVGDEIPEELRGGRK